MKNTIITAIILIVIFAMPVSVCIIPHQDIIEMERRKITPFPEIPKQLRTKKIKQFFKDLEAYYTDRIFARSTLLTLSNHLYDIGNIPQDMSKCYKGQHNWLFLGNNYDNCVDALTGRWTISDIQLKSQTDFFNNIKKEINSCGAKFYMLIGANKSTIYPEYLPRLVIPAKSRAVTPLINNLKKNGISIVDSAETLLKNKNKGLLYYRTDTHWNNLGAKIALDSFLQETGIGELPPVDLIAQGTHRGDLVDIGGYDQFPLTTGDTFTHQWKNPNHKPTINKTVLVLGDSFSEAQMYYLSGIFKNVYRVHYNKIVNNKNEIKNITTYIRNMENKPDIVIWIQVERIFLHWGKN